MKKRPEPVLLKRIPGGILVEAPIWYGPCSAEDEGYYRVERFEILQGHRPRFDKGSGKRSPSWPYFKRWMNW